MSKINTLNESLGVSLGKCRLHQLVDKRLGRGRQLQHFTLLKGCLELRLERGEDTVLHPSLPVGSGEVHFVLNLSPNLVPG